MNTLPYVLMCQSLRPLSSDGMSDRKKLDSTSTLILSARSSRTMLMVSNVSLTRRPLLSRRFGIRHLHVANCLTIVTAHLPMLPCRLMSIHVKSISRTLTPITYTTTNAHTVKTKPTTDTFPDFVCTEDMELPNISWIS